MDSAAAQAQLESESPDPTDSASTRSTSSFFVQALYDYSGADTSSLSFSQGDIIEVLSTLPSGWWDGIICETKTRGWFPSNYVQIVENEDVDWAREEMRRWWDGQDSSTRGTQSISTIDDEDHDDLYDGAIGDYTSLLGSRDIGSGLLEQFITAKDLASFSDGDDIFGEIAAATEGGHDSIQSPEIDVRHRESVYADAMTSPKPPSSLSDAEDYWIPRVSDTGAIYYFNTRTAESSAEMPIGQPSAVQQLESTSNDEDSGPMGQITSLKGLRIGDLQPSSAASVLSSWTERPPVPGPTPATSSTTDASATHPHDASSTQGDQEGDVESQIAADVERSRRAVSTIGLLAPNPPPTIAELEQAVAQALTQLAASVETVPNSSPAPGEDRNRIALLCDAAADSITTLLHCTGLLDSSSPRLTSSASLHRSSTSETALLQSALDPTAFTELRPLTRRVVSTLSKLTLSARALWALLETSTQDQTIDSDDAAFELDDAEAVEPLRVATLERWRTSRELRNGREAKARQEVALGVRHVSGVVDELVKAYSSLMESLPSTQTSSMPIRAIKSEQGCITTNAGALLLPGGGSGGSWRGNGFATLHTGQESDNYPSTRLDPAAVHGIDKASVAIIAAVEDLKTAAQASGPDSSLFEPADALLDTLAAFLAQLEDIDIAAAVDLEDDAERPSGGASKPSTSVTTLSKVESESVYCQSIADARRELAQFCSCKQAIYDAVTSITLGLQGDTPAFPAPLVSAGHPVPSPLADLSALKMPASSTLSALPISPQLEQLTADVKNACRSVSALVKISFVQAESPSPARLQRRLSIYARQTNSRPSSVPSAKDHDGRISTSGRAGLGPSSHRESADSDFFFSGVGNTPTVSTRDSDRAPLPSAWTGRRGSVATEDTSNSSQPDSNRSSEQCEQPWSMHCELS